MTTTDLSAFACSSCGYTAGVRYPGSNVVRCLKCRELTPVAATAAIAADEEDEPDDE